MKKYIFIALTALIMSSCGVLKDYERPNDITTDGIYGNALSGDSLGLGDLKWKEIFTDPQLQNLIEKALRQNTNMQNTDLQIQEVEYALKASKIAFAPSIYFNPNGAITKLWDPKSRDQYSAMTSGNSKTYTLPVTLGWQNVNFLQLRNAKKNAQWTVEQLRNVKQAVQAALVANVASLYYTLAELDEQLVLIKQTRENWGQYLDKERKLMEAGQANSAAVASIEATYWSISSSVVTIEDNIKIIENSLSTLLGESNIHINRGSLNSFKTPALVTTGAPINILARRPDVRDAEITLAKAFYDVNSAKAASGSGSEVKIEAVNLNDKISENESGEGLNLDMLN